MATDVAFMLSFVTVVGWPWLAVKTPHSHTHKSPSSTGKERAQHNLEEVMDQDKDMEHLSFTSTGKTGSAWGKRADHQVKYRVA